MVPNSTMNAPAIIILLLPTNLLFASAANILALLTIASPSHHIWNSPLLVALADRGHNVTVVSGQAQSKPVPNLTDIVVQSLVADVASAYNYTDMSQVTSIEWVRITYEFSVAGCEIVIKSEEFKQLMDYPPDFKFDLVIVESIGCECLFGAIPRFGSPPIISMNALQVPIWTLWQSGTPYFPSHMPYIYSFSTDHMTFAERFYNSLYSVHGNYLYHSQYIPEMNRVARSYFGQDFPPIEDYQQRISFVLANFHPSLDYPWAFTPTLIPIAGIQVKEPTPLPQDIQKYLDEAKHGAIYFSLGSNVRSDTLSPHIKKQILEALSELPQRILWKYESDITDLPNNVRVGKWLPQRDILAHPNIKLFITHSGALSTHETIHRGVPMVGMPFLGDQHINARRVENYGAGVKLEFKDLTKATLQKAIRTVLENPSYAKNMKALSERFRDNPVSALDLAVFWTEYALRHKGATHLRTAALDLNTAQILLIDVIAVLLGVPVFILTLLYCVCCRRKAKHTEKLKKN